MSSSPAKKLNFDMLAETSVTAPIASPVSRPALPAIHLLMKYLEAEGVDCVFGIPGGPLMPFYEALFERKKIRPILSKHEGGAAFMADGYARVSGHLGVCCTTTGPGATNALTGIACAHRDSVPVMLLTAQVALSAFGKGAFQESSPLGTDVVDLYKSVTKASVMLMAPEKMGDVVRHVLRTGLSGRPGPIHLSVPADMAKKPVPDDFREPSHYRSIAESFDRRSVREAAKLLLRAKHPAILAGYGVHSSHAFQELKNLAERLHIPVATTQKGKGVFPENHMLSLGVFGFAGSPRSEATLLSPDIDLILAVGTSLSELATDGWDPRLVEGKTLLHIDIDPKEFGKSYPVDVGLVGDAKQVLMELNYQVDRDKRWMESDEMLGKRLAKVRAIRTMHPATFNTKPLMDGPQHLHPQRVIEEMRSAMPDNSILFVDVGNVCAWALHYFPVNEPNSFFVNMGFASMGHGMVAAIGGKLAAPTRPVVSLVGDASFAMNGTEVHTAVENDIPVVWVIMNNGGHGMIHLGEKIQFGGKFNSSLFNKPLDISKISEAMGALAFRAERPGETEKAIKAAIASGRPSVVEVMVDPEAAPPTGARFRNLDKSFGKTGDHLDNLI